MLLILKLCIKEKVLFGMLDLVMIFVRMVVEFGVFLEGFKIIVLFIMRSGVIFMEVISKGMFYG